MPEDRPNNNSREDLNAVYRKLIRSPTFFCRALLGLKPYPYQEKFLEDKSKRIVVCAARQVGKSTICAAKALHFSFAHPDSRVLIVSHTQRQSMFMFDMILKYVEGSEILKRCVVRKTRTLILFTNGSQIIALPCGHRGDSLRGYTADLITIDEASFVPEQVITQVIAPMLATTNGTSILLSTPLDKWL